MTTTLNQLIQKLTTLADEKGCGEYEFLRTDRYYVNGYDDAMLVFQGPEETIDVEI